jgi:choline dehydrogenase-like flavoprotein
MNEPINEPMNDNTRRARPCLPSGKLTFYHDAMTEMDDPLYEVCIVGCGPAGATLANLLGLCGISVLVLEREGAAYPLPRAVQFDDEVMRVLQTVGLSESILPYTHVSPGMRFVDSGGRLLLDWARPMEVGPQGWNASYRFHQPDLERILREGAASRPQALQAVFLPHQWPASQLRHGRLRQEGHASLHGGAMQSRRCRPGL